MTLRTLAVVNPASAGGRTLRRWPAIAASLRGQGIDFDLHLTSAPGDATTAVLGALADGCERVLAVGGDGTLNEVVNGFFDANGAALNPAAVLGLVPSGTGGDFRRSVGVPRRADECAALIAGGSTRRLDVGRIDFAGGERRLFINIADCGIGGEVVAAVNRSRSKAGGVRGSAVFLGLSLRALLTFRGGRVRVVLDGDEVIEEKAQAVVVANGRYFGGGMHIAPGARCDDGHFDVVVVRALGRARSLTSLPSLYRGTHTKREGVLVRRAARVEIEAQDEPLLFDVEGEQIGTTPAALTCMASAISFCAPGNG